MATEVGPSREGNKAKQANQYVQVIHPPVTEDARSRARNPGRMSGPVRPRHLPDVLGPRILVHGHISGIWVYEVWSSRDAHAHA